MANLILKDMKIENGIKALKKLNKDQTIIFLDSFSYKSIAKTFSVSESTARRIMTDKIIEFDIVLPKSESALRPSRFEFVISEDDLGRTSRNNKQIITKDGMFVFEGNAPIYKVKNKLSETVKEYVNVMLNNNQPLNFVNK